MRVAASDSERQTSRSGGRQALDELDAAHTALADVLATLEPLTSAPEIST